MMIWSGILTTRVTQVARDVFESALLMDVEASAHEGPRLEVGELIARALEPEGMGLPQTDAALMRLLETQGAATTVSLTTGLVLVRAGRLALSIGAGYAVESYGPAVCRVAVTAGRYDGAFKIPNVMLLEGA